METQPTCKNCPIRPKNRPTRRRWQVGNGSLPPKPETAGQLAGLRLRNRFSTNSTISDRKVANFLSDQSRLGLIQVRSRRDSAWSLQDVLRSHRDPTRSRWDQPNLFEICRDLVKIWRLLEKSSRFSHNPKPSKNRYVPNENPTSRTDSVHQSAVGLGMRNLKWIKSVLGWPQTWPGPTRG